MARKRKKASRRRSRRRMGALAPSLKNIDFMNIAGVVGGAVLSRVWDFVIKMAYKMTRSSSFNSKERDFSATNLTSLVYIVQK